MNGVVEKVVGDHGYVPSPQRELRLKFRAMRSLSHSDFANAEVQTCRADYQMAIKARQYEQESGGMRRVWNFLDFPFGNVDLFVYTKQGQARMFKVLDWQYVYQEGDVQAELAELEASTSALHAYLQDCECFSRNGLILSFLLCPFLLQAPEDCDIRMICGEQACEQVLQTLNAPSFRGRGVNHEGEEDGGKSWKKIQQCLSVIPQYDVLHLRDEAHTVWFGNFSHFVNESSLTRQVNRTQTLRVEFEHAKQGMMAVPLALVSGVLGWEPTTRIKLNNRLAASVDVSPATKLVFTLFGSSGEQICTVTCEVNEIDTIELAKYSREVVPEPIKQVVVEW